MWFRTSKKEFFGGKFFQEYREWALLLLRKFEDRCRPLPWHHAQTKDEYGKRAFYEKVLLPIQGGSPDPTVREAFPEHAEGRAEAVQKQLNEFAHYLTTRIYREVVLRTHDSEETEWMKKNMLKEQGRHGQY